MLAPARNKRVSPARGRGELRGVETSGGGGGVLLLLGEEAAVEREFGEGSSSVARPRCSSFRAAAAARGGG